MDVRRRFGLGVFPVVTVAVFAVTATASALQFAVPGMLEHLQRSPAGLHGDWWRTITALFVQDGGVFGTVSNLAFLLAVGAAAEQFLRPGHWLVCYFGAGLCGELAGYAWQPSGAGNSVAVCGTAGALIVAMLRREPRVVPAGPVITMYWCAALLGAWTPLLVAGVLAGVLTLQAVQRGRHVQRPVSAAALLIGVALTAMRDIHGAALLAGVLIAASLALAVRRRTAAVRV